MCEQMTHTCAEESWVASNKLCMCANELGRPMNKLCKCRHSLGIVRNKLGKCFKGRLDSTLVKTLDKREANEHVNVGVNYAAGSQFCLTIGINYAKWSLLWTGLIPMLM